MFFARLAITVRGGSVGLVRKRLLFRGVGVDRDLSLYSRLYTFVSLCLSWFHVTRVGVASLLSPNACRLSDAGATGVAGVTGGVFGVKN